jgi:hypothetical protein
MKRPCRAPSACLHLDFLRDTLFGPVAQSLECHVQLAALNLQGRPALQLLIDPPLPAKLERSHSLAFDWEGRHYHGIVRHHYRYGDGGLKLLVELQ